MKEAREEGVNDASFRGGRSRAETYLIVLDETRRLFRQSLVQIEVIPGAPSLCQSDAGTAGRRGRKTHEV